LGIVSLWSIFVSLLDSTLVSRLRLQWRRLTKIDYKETLLHLVWLSWMNGVNLYIKFTLTNDLSVLNIRFLNIINIKRNDLMKTINLE
jgi:hypothetical protein